MLDALTDAALDTVKLLPILFLTYLLMEYLEHCAGEKLNRRLKASRKAGPAVGAAFGLVPQCGFSGAAANLYASGTVTVGTLLAVFLATSDEMLPIFLSSHVPVKTIVFILAVKFLTGLAVGYAVDLLLRKRLPAREKTAHDLCEQEHCHCENNIFLSALRHTVKITLLLFVITFLLNLAFWLLPEERLSAVWRIPVVGTLLSALIGLIPNCSASVLISNLYISGMSTLPALLAGLLTNAGVGLLVLFRVNADKRENLLITAVLFLSGAAIGGLLGFLLQGLPLR